MTIVYEFECSLCGLYRVSQAVADPFLDLALTKSAKRHYLNEIIAGHYIGFRIIFTRPNCPRCSEYRQYNFIIVQVLLPPKSRSQKTYRNSH